MPFEEVQIGPCRLIRGDCLEVLPTLEAGSVDAVVTDPPYGIQLQSHCVGQCMDGSKRQRRTSDDWRITGDDSHHAADFSREWATRRNVPLAMFGSAYKPYGGEWRNILVWNKGLAVGGGGDPKKCWKRTHELIFIANNSPLRAGRDGSVINWPITPSNYELHQAQKPVGLVAYLIEQMTDDDDSSVDPFMGSGTTGVACIQTRRRFLGIEIDKHHFDTACRRIEKAWKEHRSKLPLEECDALQTI